MAAVVEFGGKMDVTPGEALLDLVQHKAAECHYWRAKVLTIEELIGPESVGGLMEVERTSGSGNMGPAGRWGEQEQTKWQVVIHVWYQLLRNCERDLAAYCAAAMRAGVEERAVRVAESLGMQMLGALEEVMHELRLTAEQQIIAGQVVPRVLRGLSAPSS